MFWEALSIDLIGAPEFLIGVYLAKLCERLGFFRGGRLMAVSMGLALFVATGFLGTGLRLLLYGTPSPGFISFGFGVTIVPFFQRTVS